MRTLTQALTVSYTLGGTATCGTDYTIAGADCTSLTGTFTLPAGTAAFADIRLLLVPIADNEADSGETIVVTLVAGQGYGLGNLVTVTVTLYDDTGSAAFSIAGTPRVGATLTATKTADDPDGNGTGGFSYQWQYRATPSSFWSAAQADSRGCDDAPTCTPNAQAEGGELRVRVNYADGNGYPSSVATAPVGPVLAALPVVSIAGGPGVTEGAGATFTLTATPAPASSLPVSVTVSQTGSFAAPGQTGTRTVTVGTSGTATFTVGTVNDATDETDGSVQAAVSAGAGYTVDGAAASASVAVADNDGQPTAEPQVTVAAASTGPVPEGGTLAFLLSASPAPSADLTVHYTVTDAPGADFVASGNEGARTAVLGAGQSSASVTVATVGDTADEPGGPVTVTVDDATGYAPGTAATAAVAVTDNDPTTVTLTGPTGDIPEAGGAKTFTVTLGRAPAAGEWFHVPLLFGGTATPGADWTATCAAASGVYCGSLHIYANPTIELSGANGAPASIAVTVAAVQDSADEPDETVTVALGALKTNAGGGAAGTGTLGFAIADDDEPLPVVTVSGGAGVTEGTDAAFTLSVDTAPSADLTVHYRVADDASADFVAGDDEGAKTAVIGAGQTSTGVTVPTVADTTDEPDGRVTLTVTARGGYRVGSPAQAAVAVADDDTTPGPTISIADATAGEGRMMLFTITLSAPQTRTVYFDARTRESTPVSAVQYVDFLGSRYHSGTWQPHFRPGQTRRQLGIYIWDDAHNEGPETFELVLENPRGATIADAVGVGTITNADPLPAAYLARFGRTVAQAALDGIAGRMGAERTPGMRGTLAGQALGFGPAPGRPADDKAVLAMADIARGLGAEAPGPEGDGIGLDRPRGQSRTMTAQEALLGSSFSLTAQRDGAGGSLALWGRASQGRFDGVERGDGTDIRLDGTVTTGMLGADYARGDWLLGLALTQSTSEGGYASEGQPGCPEVGGDAPVLCEGAVRAGDGKVEASLTAAVPYASLKVSERLKLWGAAGVGSGEVTLKTAMGKHYSADTGWTMAAAGVRGDLLDAPREGSGPALALTSDALWARTSSEKTRDLAASDSGVTRLRLGLEGSYRMAMENGASLTPKLEAGARHDGGDAETGFGVELGGGIAWSAPALGLVLDVSGRTLVAHEDGDLEDRGLSAALAFDPAPATERGLSFSLRQELGGRAQGGLDALFAPAPLEDRTGGEATSRWTMEAAYGFPVFGGRFTGSPHAGLGLATGARDWSLGWRLTPEAANAPDLSLGLRATRRESDTQAPVHTVGVEATMRW